MDQAGKLHDAGLAPRTLQTRLNGRGLFAARLGWMVVVVLSAVVLVAGLWTSVTDAIFTSLPVIAAEVDIALYRVFTNNQFLGSTFLHIIALCQTIAFVAVALIMVAQRPDDWLILLTSAMLISTGVGFAPSTFFLPIIRPEWWLPVTILQILLFSSLVVFLFIFPNGRFVPRMARVVAAGWAVYALTWLMLPQLNPHRSTSPIALFIFITMVMVALAAQIYRYRAVSNPVERQQSKWVLAGFLTTNICFFFLVTLSVAGITPRLEAIAPLPVRLLNTILGLSSILIPITIGIAISRYRLWDIDLFINRALVYGSLTALIAGLYVIVVGGLGLAFQTGNNLILSVLATGLIAVLFNPVRVRLQEAVNRLMYGERDDPMTVVARLGRRLADTAAAADLLPVLVETIADALKLPYVGLATDIDGRAQIVAETGTSTGDVQRVPLVFQSEQVGTLLAAPRSPQEPFTSAELRLLTTIAHQAGGAVHATKLNTTLQHSREQLVLAQEEERRRLQRDLHDGLGPQLAAITMRLEVAQHLVYDDPEGAARLLDELKGESQAAIADIRRLVYGLRPPVLDQLGLAQAIREFAATSATSGSPHLEIEIGRELPPLPAAVETAVYRITTEAIANCFHHAAATKCRVSIHVGDWLFLKISDDGCGLPTPLTPGVGLTSMRQRAAELGGRIDFRRPSAGGTAIEVHLPISGETVA